MAKINVIMATGVAFPDAVKAALGRSIRDFARGHEPPLQENVISALINGSTPYKYERERQALADALGVEREWLDLQIDAQRERAIEGKGAASDGAGARPEAA